VKHLLSTKCWQYVSDARRVDWMFADHITSAIAGISLEDDSPDKQKAKKRRCDICRKRVGLTGMLYIVDEFAFEKYHSTLPTERKRPSQPSWL